MATPRTPPAKQVDPVADRAKATQAAYARQLKHVADHFAKAAMEVQAATPGTIGRQQAEQRAKACRKALEETVATLVKRERLDAHARTFARIDVYLESLSKHAALPATDARVLERAVRKIRTALREMKDGVEQQRNALDEASELDIAPIDRRT